MFLEIIKDMRTGNYVSHFKITKEELIKKHKYHMDLCSWASVGRIDSRFGFSNDRGQFLYVKTNEIDTDKLEKIAKKLCL